MIGGAFQSAYTIRKGSSTSETTPPSDERSSSRMSELSTMSTASCAFPNQTRAIPTLTSTLDSGNNTEPVSNSSADDCFEPCYLESVEDTFCNFRHDYDPSSNSNRINSGPGSSSIGTSSNSDRSISNKPIRQNRRFTVAFRRLPQC